MQLIEPRLATSIQVSAFVRLANAGGDFATVIRKGDPVSGAILLIGMIKGGNPVIFERFPSLEGGSSWQPATQDKTLDETQISEIWKRRADRDPDLWVIELDVASRERLVGLLG